MKNSDMNSDMGMVAQAQKVDDGAKEKFGEKHLIAILVIIFAGFAFAFVAWKCHKNRQTTKKKQAAGGGQLELAKPAASNV